jgi:hypothetical protein
MVRWESDGDDKDKGRWVVSVFCDNLFVKSSLESIVYTVSRRSHGGSVPESSWWDRVVGGAKEVVNQVVDANRALANEWYAEKGVFHYIDRATGRELSPQEVAELYRNDSPDTLKPEGPGEEAGAQMVRDNQATAAAVSMAMALSSKFRSVVRNPDEFAEDLRKALTHSRSETEAFGELGMHQAQRRLGMESDPRFINRYHGPDDITRKNNKLGEWEGKGSQDNQVRVAKDTDDFRQGSSKKNLKRAKTMTKKQQQGKVGQTSNRQGGAYTDEEMELYEEIWDRRGEKQHFLTHTNTETGIVRTFKQVDGGKIGEKIDEFKIENFKEAKAAIKEYFTK